MNKGKIVACGSIGEIFEQQELLTSVRLDVPCLPKLIRSLRERGIDIDMAYTYQEAESAFLRAFKGEP
jgi:cobalt/nickel transport system ATP-binding protein